jgi:hypothetical protein
MFGIGYKEVNVGKRYKYQATEFRETILLFPCIFTINPTFILLFVKKIKNYFICSV